MKTLRIPLAVLALTLPTTALSQTPPDFPYPLVETSGYTAIRDWERLQDAPGTPIIIGERKDVEDIAYILSADSHMADRSIEAILEDAAKLTFPKDHTAQLQSEWTRMRAYMIKEGYGDETLPLDRGSALDDPQVMGRWPDTAYKQTTVLSLSDVLTGRPIKELYIAILPTEDATEAAAYLKFGDWNANPSPEMHVAAARYWQEQAGAIPIYVGFDVIEYKVTKPPQTKQAAIQMAAIMYDYCEDIVTQGVGSVSDLGATIQGSPYWYFWWD